MVIKYFGHCRSEKITKVCETIRFFQQSLQENQFHHHLQIWSMISDHLKKIITSILIWQPPPPHQCSMLEWSIKSVKRPNGRFPHPAPFQTDWTGFGLRRPVDTTQLYYLHLCPLYICVHYTLSHRINQFLPKMPWDIYLRSIIVVPLLWLIRSQNHVAAELKSDIMKLRPIPWSAVCQKLFVKWFRREKIGNDNFLHSMNNHHLCWGGCKCLTWLVNMLTFVNQFLMKW